MAHRFLAFDLGAESGRAVAGTLDGGTLATREVRRFPNLPLRLSGHLHWNVYDLLGQMKAAMADCARAGADEAPESVAVDTWGVDFGLLARDGSLLGLPFCYRDARTRGALEDYLKLVPAEAVYGATGVQFLPFNTLFQIYAMVRERSPLLEAAAHLLFMPDLFTHFLCGRRVAESTIASTSQFYDPRAKAWARGLFQAMGFSRRILEDLVAPGTTLGPLLDDVAAETGLQGTTVVATAGHDTAAAVAAVPAEGDRWAYISSGTWSLVGVELPSPLVTEEARAANFTNEGGVGGTTRFLRNVSGLWPVQQCRAAWAREAPPLSYDEITDLAAAAPPFRAVVDPDHPDFLSPEDMPAAIAAYCSRTGQGAPGDKGALVRSILESLALKYRVVLDRIEAVTGRRIEVVHVIGGGSRNRLLNQFTADATGRRVVAGPVEATAAGNILVQALAAGRLESPARIREVVRASTRLETYEPSGANGWDEALRRFRGLAA